MVQKKVLKNLKDSRVLKSYFANIVMHSPQRRWGDGNTVLQFVYLYLYML